MEKKNNIIAEINIDRSVIVDFEFAVKNNKITLITEDVQGKHKVTEHCDCFFPEEEIFVREEKGKLIFERLEKTKILENKFRAVVIDKFKGINAGNGPSRIKDLKDIFFILLNEGENILIKINKHAYTLNTLSESFKNNIASQMIIGKVNSDYSNIEVEINKN